MKTATGNGLLRAYSRAAKNLIKDPGMAASAVSAGFIIPNGQKRGKKTGFQVFVKVCQFSEQRLKEKPKTGGLFCEI
jgi:hypothetical protein